MKFQGPAQFVEAQETLELLPFRFERIDSERHYVTNLVGDVLLLTNDELNRLADLDLSPGDGLYERAFERFLIRRNEQLSQVQLLAARLRTRLSFLQEPNALNILVVTLRCEHSCPYCQVSRRSTDKDKYDMSEETAHKSIDIALSAPPSAIKIEFQGGEPLLNFSLIQKAVLYAENLARVRGKKVEFVIATNLALLDDAILDFCRLHSIYLSTSLDGPPDLHDRNRPRPGGNSHALVVDGIKKAKAILGGDHVGALMTTTNASLDRVEDIVDEYVRLDLDGIFLRPLSPYGFAVKTKQYSAYDVESWLVFYERGLRYILELNKKKRFFPEFYAALFLKRLFTDQPTGYVDLRSPAGIGLGALVYNYDGSVFAADEGRMLAEMGDRTFELGNVNTNDYFSIVLSDKLINLIGSTLTQTSPQCAECAFEPHCGSDPVYHHATQSDLLGIKSQSGFCARQKGVMRLLLELLETSPDDAAILRSWVG